MKLPPEKVSEILEMLKKKDPPCSIFAISGATGVARKTVSALKKKFDEEINGPFYEERLKEISAEYLVKICRDASYDPAPDTTKLQDDKSIPLIRKSLLDMHRAGKSSPNARGSLVQKYNGGGKNFHGFFIYPPVKSYDGAVVNPFLLQMESDAAQFTPIFEYTQAGKGVPEGPAHKKSKTDKVSIDDKRMGDGLRRHLIWEEWIAVVLKRKTESQDKVSRLQRELNAAQDKLNKFSAADPASQRSTRHTENLPKSTAEKTEAAQSRCDDLRGQLAAATKAHAAAVECDRQTQLVEAILCDNYKEIIANSPYTAMNVHQTITDRRLLSIILALPEAGSQTMHADSLQRGCSLLMSARKRQYLIILLNGFRAMRSLDRMLLRRADALRYVRDRIAAGAPGDASCWGDQAEHRIWNYLCCLQFEHEGISAIEAVRVPIEAGETLVVDNRTLHGGSRGEETPGFRFHVYCYDQDISLRQGAERLQKDQDVTFDPLDERLGFYPVCRWAQTKSAQPVFRA